VKKLILLAGVLLSLASAPLPAQGGVYIGAFGGQVAVDESSNETPGGSFNMTFDPGQHWGAVLGFDLGDTYPAMGIGRIEMEASQRQSEIIEIAFAGGARPATGTMQVESLMFNTFGELRQIYPLLPYYGAGAGVARLRLEGVGSGGGTVVEESEDTVFAWQVGAGLGYQVCDRLALDVGYRYFKAVEPEFEDRLGETFLSEYQAHSVVFGVRWMF